MTGAPGPPAAAVAACGCLLLGLAARNALRLRRARRAQGLRQARRLALARWGRPLLVLPPVRRRGLDAAVRRRALLAQGRSATADVAVASADGAEVVAALRGACLVGGWVLALAAAWLSGPAVGAAVAMTAWAVLDVRLAVAASRGRIRLEADLPAALRVTAAALAAGLGAGPALQLAARTCEPPLRPLLLAAAAADSPPQALQATGTQCADAVLASAGAWWARASALGHPAAPVLRAAARQADERAERTATARAARAAPLATLITAGVVAPACVIALVVLLGASLLNGVRSGL